MATGIDHVLLTRFNLPSQGHESLVRAQENWLRDRVALFERYCLPSVAAQTCQNFSWIIYFDPQSPEWLREWITDHERQSHFHAVYREEVHRPDLVGDIQAVVGEPHGTELLTTNVDNDDSIATDFVSRLQAAAWEGERSAVYLADGLIRSDDLLYRRVDRHNAFCSVRETWEQPVTCWVNWHNLLPEMMPAVILRGGPAWLQVVHGGNVSNRVRGRLTSAARHRTVFPGVLDALPEPTARQRTYEALVAVPVRALRETCRAVVKATLMTIAGKRGLDRMKHLMAAVRRLAAR